ncbi:MAG: futalosine hydrolase [Candidatus Dadabacteria bacterium]
MRILLCSATTFEIAPTIEYIRNNKKDVEVALTGVGMLAATYAITKAIDRYKPDFILQAGVAGCIDPNLPLTKVVLVENEIIGDLGVQENESFRDIFQLRLADLNTYPFTNGRLRNNVAVLQRAGLPLVDAVTVNEISTKDEKIRYYRETLHAAIESMEGAALHYVALQENVRFLQLRALSNFVGERDKSKWVLDIAIERLNTELIRILSKL